MRTCFIIMPFSETNNGESNLEEKDLTHIYNDFIKKAVRSFKTDDKPFFNEVARFDQTIGSIIKGIVEKLNSSDLVIADLTGNNPNVMYELGVRHSLNRGTIMLTQDFSTFPSDLRDYLAIEYKFPTKSSDYDDCYREFETKLHQAIEQVLNTEKHDSPVLELLNYKTRFKDLEEIDNIKEQVIILKSFYSDLVTFDTVLENFYKHQDIKNNQPDRQAIEVMSLFINSLASKLSLLDFSVNDSNLIVDVEMTKNFLSELDRSIQMDNYPHLIMNIPEGENIFQTTTIKELLEKEYIDPVFLRKNGDIKRVKFLNAFSESEFIKKNIFDEAIEIIGDSAERLGVKEEIENLIKEFDPSK